MLNIKKKSLFTFMCFSMSMACTEEALALVHTYPNSDLGSPCSVARTLQYCVNGVATSDIIEIATNTPIVLSRLDLSEKRNLTIRKADGYKPIINAEIYFNYSSSIPVQLTLEGFQAKSIEGTVQQIGGAVIKLRNLDIINHQAPDSAYIRIEGEETVRLTIEAYNNRITGTSSGNLVDFINVGGGMEINASFNTITNNGGTASAGMYAGYLLSRDGVGSADGNATFFGNTLRGNFVLGGIYVDTDDSNPSRSPLATPLSRTRLSMRAYNNVIVCNQHLIGESFTSGISILPTYSGSFPSSLGLRTWIFHNTISGCGQGIVTKRLPGKNFGVASGYIDSNLIVTPLGVGLDIAALDSASLLSSPGAGLANDYNLTIATRNTVPAGPNDIPYTAGDPLLFSMYEPRLVEGSIAIDSGNNVGGSASFFRTDLRENNLPKLDADGLKRFKGSRYRPDVGAYEYGNTSFTVVRDSVNANGSSTDLNHEALNSRPMASSFVTHAYPSHIASGVYSVSFSEFSGLWSANRLTNNDQPLPVGNNHHVFAPAASEDIFTHPITYPSIADTLLPFLSDVDHPSLNGLPNQFVLVSQTVRPGSMQNLNPVALNYGALNGHWRLYNINQANMQVGATYDFYVQEPSPNAFRMKRPDGVPLVRKIVIDHPLINNTACANIQITRVSSGGGALNVIGDRIVYEGNRWFIYSDGDGIAQGEEFNVLINPAQIAECKLFSDSFED